MIKKSIRLNITPGNTLWTIHGNLRAYLRPQNDSIVRTATIEGKKTLQKKMRGRPEVEAEIDTHQKKQRNNNLIFEPLTEEDKGELTYTAGSEKVIGRNIIDEFASIMELFNSIGSCKEKDKPQIIKHTLSEIRKLRMEIKGIASSYLYDLPPDILSMLMDIQKIHLINLEAKLESLKERNENLLSLKEVLPHKTKHIEGKSAQSDVSLAIKKRVPPHSYGTFDDLGQLKETLLKNRERILRDTEKGFSVGNIRVNQFIAESYTYKRGEVISFKGWTLLNKFGLKWNIVGIVNLLKFLGIEVKGAAKLRKELPSPTKEEYQDNDLIRSVLLRNKDRYLRCPDKGFVAGNIKVMGFLYMHFEYIDKRKIKKSVTGLTILNNRGIKGPKIGDIVNLFNDVGIIVTGDAISRRELPLLGQRYYQSDEILRKILQGNSAKYLKGPEFAVNNIKVAKFSKTRFEYTDENNIKRSTTGQRILVNRGFKGSGIEYIVRLLKSVGIEVKGKVLAQSLQEEMLDGSFMRRAILDGRDQFLKMGNYISTRNIRPNKFFTALFHSKNEESEEKWFTGRRALNLWGYSRTKNGVVSLLNNISINVARKDTETVVKPKHSKHEEDKKQALAKPEKKTDHELTPDKRIDVIKSTVQAARIKGHMDIVCGIIESSSLTDKWTCIPIYFYILNLQGKEKKSFEEAAKNFDKNVKEIENIFHKVQNILNSNKQYNRFMEEIEL